MSISFNCHEKLNLLITLIFEITLSSPIYHTIRFANPPSWQAWRNVNSNSVIGYPSAQNAIRFISAACAASDLTGDELHVFASVLSDDLFHTIRYSSWSPHQLGWQQWGNVNDAVPKSLSIPDGKPNEVRWVACAGISGNMHVIVQNWVDQLWYTIRNPFSSTPWRPWELLANSLGNQHIACAGRADELHVIFLLGDGRVFHTIRDGLTSSWKPWYNIANSTAGIPPQKLLFVACATVGNDLHVIGVGSLGDLFHTIRYDASGDWQHWESVSKTVSTVNHNPGSIVLAGCAGIGNDLHIVVSTYPKWFSPGKVFHTIRFGNTMSWQPWGNVSDAAANYPVIYGEWMAYISCAAIGNDLHVIGVKIPVNII